MKNLWLSYLLSTASLCAAGSPEPVLTNIPPSQPFVFAVLGDNRGDDSGQQPPTFFRVLNAIQDQRPAFVLDSGDMIYGRTVDEDRVRAEWRIYREAVAGLRCPIFHVPGNHDIWDEQSARIYRQLWGNTYFSFAYGNSFFIGLDTESAGGRLGEQQVRWLEQQLASCAQSNVFVFFHRPLFPVDGAIGSSLDAYPSERERVHSLFIRHRTIMRGVFVGHEHLYSFQQRDGISYYTSGGAGAPLYTAPELGGFHHFLLVHVQGDRAQIQVKKLGASARPLEKPRPVIPGELLENWDLGLLWYAWDRTAAVELTPEAASHGQRGLRLNFDLDQYAWPVLVLAPASPWDLRGYESLSFDLFVPPALGAGILVTPALQGLKKHEAPPCRLDPGWNTVSTRLDSGWLDRSELRRLDELEWSLSARDPKAQGFVVFDNLRLKRPNSDYSQLLESFERPLLWRVFDETVRAEIISTNNASAAHGLALHIDFATCNRPVVFAQLNPPWDLTGVKALLLQTEVADSLPQDLAINLIFRVGDVEYRGPRVPLHRGAQQLRFELGENWLPAQARAEVGQVGFILVSTNRTRSGCLTFEKLIAASNS